MPKTKKCWYSPGLISLIGMFFLVPYAYNKMKSPDMGEIFLNVPTEEDSTFSFSGKALKEYLRHRKKICFILDSNERTNSEKISIIRQEALKLKYTNDTSAVVITTFTDNAPYSVFIKLLDIANADQHKSFFLFKNEFFIYHQVPRQQKKSLTDIPMFLCGTPGATQKKEVQTPIKSTSTNKEQTSLLSGWLLLLIISVYYRKGNFRRNSTSTSLPSSGA